MIAANLFYTLAFPWLFVNPNGGIVERGGGTLFKLPSDADEAEATESGRLAPVGFSVDRLGYAIYVHEVPELRKYRIVLYGLKVVGVSTVQGKNSNLSIRMTREQIQLYVDGFLAGIQTASRLLGDLLNSSVHEIRGINTDIKHASREIMSQESEQDIEFDGIIRRAKNINALTEIMSQRTDFLDFVSSPYVTRVQRRRIRPYQKFDKVKRSLESRARQKGVRMRLEGASVGFVDALVVFDVVPYLVVQNAVKYSPEGEEVVIRAAEEQGWIEFSVTNWGPEILEEERSAIFEQGVRSRASKKTGVTGSGVGLYFLKELVAVHHRGQIELWQEGDARLVRGIPFRLTTVCVRFPRALE